MARVLWVVGLAALAVLVLYAMRRGWLNRARRQAAELDPFPRPPAGLDGEPALLPSAQGLYVGTTRAGDWQDRVAVGDIGHRASTTATLRPSGLLLDRSGASEIWIPVRALRAVRVDHKLANKVVPGAGLLVVTWQLGDQLLDTGFRDEDKARQNEWAEAIGELIPDDGSTAAVPSAAQDGSGAPGSGQDDTAGARQEEK